MEHTFLLLEALWRTEGEFFDGTGNRAQVEGQASIRHYPEKWIYEGSLRTVGARPVEHRTIYEIQPLAPGNLATGWTSSSASCACGSSGDAACGAGGVMAWERGRREGGARVRRALMSTILPGCQLIEPCSFAGATALPSKK